MRLTARGSPPVDSRRELGTMPSASIRVGPRRSVDLERLIFDHSETLVRFSIANPETLLRKVLNG